MEKMKASVIIQARMGARRLPGKVLLKTCGKSVLEHIIERVSRAKRVDQIVIATTISEEDLPIVSFAASKGIKVFCGSEQDVLDRYYQAARLFEFKHIVRITGDCPLIDPKIIDDIIGVYFKHKVAYAANGIEPTFPDGEDVEVFSFQALEKAWEKAVLASQREHVTSFIRDNAKKFKQYSFKQAKDLSQLRWTLDEPQDWVLIRKIFQHLYPLKPAFSMQDILQALDQHPQWNQVNGHIKRNEGYALSLKKDKVVTHG